MPSKRQPSKQKRASQNRAQRAALSARRDNVSAPPSSGSGSTSGGGRPSLLGRLRGAGGSSGASSSSSTSSSSTSSSSTSSSASSSSSGSGSGTSAAARRAEVRAAQPIGYRAALSGVMAAGAAVLLCLVFIKVPVTADGDLYTKERLVAEWATSALGASDAAPSATAAQVVDGLADDEWAPGRDKDLLVKALWPYSAFIVAPVLGSVLGFRAVSRRRPSKIISRAMFATLFGAVLTQGLFLVFLPSILALGVAMFQVRKYETTVAAAAAAEAGDGDDGADEDVIDVDVVDADVVDADPADADADDDTR